MTTPSLAADEPQAPRGRRATDPRAARTPKPRPEPVDETIAQVGARVRALRLRQGLTLRAVAEQTGVSVSMLSMLERGVASASVGTLVSVASALGVHMYDLFDHPAEPASPVTRRDEQTVVALGEGTTRRIAHHDAETGLELAVNSYLPGGESGPGATRHDGRELGLLVSGSLVVELAGAEHALGEGDVIAYSSARPHRIRNAGEGEAVAIWVNLDAG
jgi:transcriptional regulator with XRE-family HTH domain